jgi:intracellular sulfur oxidation DsrE/DsrF family protein
MTSRKHFIAAAALGVSATAFGTESSSAAEASPLHFHVLLRGEYDRERMMRTIKSTNENKQVFESVSPLTVAGVPSLYLHMQNSLNCFEFSYGMGRGSLATLAVLTGPSVAYALADDLWKKYGFGAAFNLAPTNVYYTAASLKQSGSPDDPDSIYQDWSAQAVLHRGGAFMVCHNALTALATLLAPKAAMQPAQTLAEFERGLLSGFQIVPSGVGATQLALNNGWKLYPVI